MYRAYYKTYNLQSQIRRSRRPRQQPSDVTASADIVWAAAAYADRMNGGEYRKEREYLVRADGTLTDQVVREPNRLYMWQAIESRTLITEQDRGVGEQARDWSRKRLVMQGLRGNMTEFDQALSRAVEMEEFLTGSDRYEIALITSQIRAWREGTRMASVMDDINRQPVAAVGDKIQTRCEVVKSVFSTNYNVYFVTAKTETNQLVFFSYREGLAVGRTIDIKGTVKAHRPDATQLNRVRIAE